MDNRDTVRGYLEVRYMRRVVTKTKYNLQTVRDAATLFSKGELEATNSVNTIFVHMNDIPTFGDREGRYTLRGGIHSSPLSPLSPDAHAVIR